MNGMTKKYINTFIFQIIVSIIGIVTLALLIRSDVLDGRVESVSKYTLITNLLIFFVTGVFLGIISKRDGLVNGAMYGTVIIVFMIIFKFLGLSSFNLAFIIKSIFLILSITFGSLIGVNVSSK